MAATATTDEQIVSKPDVQITFRSRRQDLRLTIKQRYPIRDPVSGQPAGMTPGIFVGFRDHAFRCPPTGKFKVVDTLDGGEAEVEAEDIIARLEDHRLFGNREEGFWRETQPAPAVSRSELKALMRAAARLDAESLERALVEEQQGWNRPDMLEAIQENLDEIAAMIAEAEKSQAEAEAAAETERKAAEKAAKAKPAG